MSEGSAADAGALAARIRRLEDIEAIRTLRGRYHDYLNSGRFELISGLYTADARVRIGAVAAADGTEQIHAFFLSIPRDLKLIKQFIHNHLVEIDGDAATGIAYMDARYGARGESLIVTGKFDERYVRTGEGWRIAETLVTLNFSVPITVGWAGPELHYIPGATGRKPD